MCTARLPKAKPPENAEDFKRSSTADSTLAAKVDSSRPDIWPK
jgi:hypothetical protein